MAASPAGHQVQALRSFNRFYTKQIGVLEEGLLATPYTLAQARVLFELGTRRAASASEIAAALGLDHGYLSRIVRAFSAQRLVTRAKSARDGRRAVITLTPKGRKEFQTLDRKSRGEVSALLARLPGARRTQLLASLRDVESIMTDRKRSRGREIVVRQYGIGDVGWAIERHARVYADEYRWNEAFEALVASLFAKFATAHDPAKERFWVAEIDGERAGCVFVVRNDENPRLAQLRCLLVEPKARGLGLGRRLVDECIAFARAAGYPKIMLWTNDVLVSARRIYEAAGFKLERQEPHHSFGHDLVGQFWVLDLR
jgi:DNA-binding MarR family transcriptional regulator/N-acetylglutamate synthase-like GNAT family acetyltransferase